MSLLFRHALLACLSALPLTAGDLPPLKATVVVEGLDKPVSVTAPRGDTSRIFVLEQVTGHVRIVVNGVLQVDPYLDLSAKTVGGGERGLLGLAFHPDFDQNGRLFVYYTDLLGDSVLEEYGVPDPQNGVPDPASAQVLLNIPQPFPQHNAGTLAFGPEGYLHISSGDGGSGGDPFNNAQSIDNLLGKILRIDVDSGSPYAVPPSNPLVGVPGAAEEIFVWGLRNPWRFTIDTPTGDMYIADVGQSLREEIDFVPGGSGGGLNFGWNCFEGNLCNTPSGCDCAMTSSFTPPIYEYDHNVGCSISGGLLYRGDALPEMQGRYLFADYCVGRIWSLEYTGGPDVDLVDHTTELSQGGFLGLITAVGKAGDGEPYFLSYSAGQLLKIEPGEPVADCDGDGTPDADELAAGTSFDVNGNGIPDECELALTVGDVVPGEFLDFQLIGAGPGFPVFTFYSIRGIGEGPCFLPDLCLDLIPFNVDGAIYVPILSTNVASAQGEVAYSLLVPPGINIALVAFQCLVFDGLDSVKSNPVQKANG